MDKEKTHTSPGPDGLPTRLFSTKALRPIFAKLFADMANFITKYGQLPDCFIDLFIRILGKPGKDLVDIKNYRPIALMQICLRIICKGPTNRLLRVLHLLIDHQQLAYIPGRRIDHASFLLQQFLVDALKEASEVCIMDSDIMKAFDSLDHVYIECTLVAQRIHPNMIKMVMTIITSLMAKVCVNDQDTKSFKIGWGIPQGASSISAIIFILCFNPLISLALNHEMIAPGVTLGLSLNLQQAGSTDLLKTSMLKNLPSDLFLSQLHPSKPLSDDPDSIKADPQIEKPNLPPSNIPELALPVVHCIIYADDHKALCKTWEMAAWWIYFYDIFKPISGLARSTEKTVLHLLGKSFWTQDPSQGDILVPTRKALDTIASIKSHPALSSLKIEIGADFKNCGLIFSIQDLANDEEYCSTALTKKTWEKGAKCISSFQIVIHILYYII